MPSTDLMSPTEDEIRKWAQNAYSGDLDLMKRTILVLSRRFERTDHLSTRCLNCGHEWPDVLEEPGLD